MENYVSESESPLTLFLEYEYLPVVQQASVLWAIAGIYEAILPRIVSDPERLLTWKSGPYSLIWEQRGIGFRPIFGPPLCILSSETGNSITIKFDIERKWFPHAVFRKGDLEILIPRWTAAVVLVGAALTFGIGEYQRFLEIQKNQLEVEKLRIEIEQLKPKRLEKDPRLQLHRQEFLLERSAPNILHAEVNGVPVEPNQ
jgi:hypothetical protein